VAVTIGPELLGASVHESSVPPLGDAAWAHLPVIESSSYPGSLVVVADRREAVVDVVDVARFHVADGTSLRWERQSGSPDELVRAWLHGAVVSVIAAQQLRFGLHASVVELVGIRGGVAGRSRAGKSTSVLAAVAAGGRFICDDLAIIRPHAGHGAALTTFGRSIHVWGDTASRLGVDLTGARRIQEGHDKWAIEGPAGADGRLDALVVLWVDPDADVVRHERAAPDDAVRAVRNQTYRRRLLDEVWPVESFQWQVEVARSIPITRVARPERWCTDEIVELLRTVAAQVGS
jgi:hypothetical protein